ncbi:PAS domain-containing protein [uncultured Algibacter sp.]|uniref:PAS domain-containing protein n=1 Tax=uncultured Algibacter sp. TaxID=298659 RepID=UPI00262BB790|nr:PAS domain-containing protein [uncultured Algibacter sp.]
MKIKQGPLKCWDIYSEHLANQTKSFNTNCDIETLKRYQCKLGWYTDLPSIIRSYEYDVLVLTDNSKQIIWTNKEFSRMTGYPVNYAIGKKPNFLQGEETCKVTLGRIRNNLKKGIPFNDVVTNYKKSGSIYKCKINIFPLKNNENDITHFLALEMQVR